MDTESIPEITAEQMQRQVQLYSPVDAIRRVFLGSRTRLRGYEIRNRLDNALFLYTNPGVQRALTNPVSFVKGDERWWRPRSLTEESSAGLSMELLSGQIKSCIRPMDFVRVMNIAFKSETGAKLFESPTLQRLMLKKLIDWSNSGQGRSEEALYPLAVLRRQLALAGVPVWRPVIPFAIEMAARGLSMSAVESWLWEWRQHTADRLTVESSIRILSHLVHRSQVAQQEGQHFDVTAMAQVLTGFKHRAGRTNHHLFAHLEASDPQSVILWIKALTCCREAMPVQRLWQRQLREWLPTISPSILPALQAAGMSRVAHAFMEAFFELGEPERAWLVFETTSHLFKAEDHKTWHLLLNNLDSKAVLPDSVARILEQRLAGHLDVDLRKIEHVYGVRWIPDRDNLSGHHEFIYKEPLNRFIGINSARSRPHASERNPAGQEGKSSEGE